MSDNVIIAIIGGLFTLVGGVTIALFAFRSNKGTNTVTFAQTLVDRLETVEREVASLKQELSKSQRALQSAIRFIDRLVDWGRSGGKGARPNPPASLHEYLDADLWAVGQSPHPEDPDPPPIARRRPDGAGDVGYTPPAPNGTE